MTDRPMKQWAIDLAENPVWKTIQEEFGKEIIEFRNDADSEEYGCEAHRELTMKAKHFKEALDYIEQIIENTKQERKHVQKNQVPAGRRRR